MAGGALSRRSFLQRSAGTIFYVLAAHSGGALALSRRDKLTAIRGKGSKPNVNSTEWIRLDEEGQITVFTGRNELGQGLRTVLYDLLCQAFELPAERITLVMGDTGLCPNDGPTTGSAATRYVAWSFWQAAFQIRDDLLRLAAQKLDRPKEAMVYERGYVVDPEQSDSRLAIGELAKDYTPAKNETVPVDVHIPQYIDPGSLNIDADEIVTGAKKFAGDWMMEGVRYGAIVVPEYHDMLTKPQSVDVSGLGDEAAEFDIYRKGRNVIIVGDSYPAVQRAESKIRVDWMKPKWPEKLITGDALRAGAELDHVIVEKGDPEAFLARAEHRISETYMTQNASQVPLETDTALAYPEGDGFVIRMGSQAPFLVQHRTAYALDLEPDQVRVISTPAGGAFGSKAGHLIGEETLHMVVRAGTPIKHVYSRKADIQHRSRYKEVVLCDLSTGVDANGKITARKIDIYQDRGEGTDRLYAIENERTRLFQTKVQVRHAVMRGTSFTQSVFSLESHTESVARQIGMDPLEFRRINLQIPEYVHLIDRCEALLGKPATGGEKLEGVGYGIIHHGAMQLGCVGANVSVDPATGAIQLKHLAGVFDIGPVISRNMALMGVKGAMIWGVGTALYEQVHLDGHRCHTAGFRDYHIARMRDVPEITVEFTNLFNANRPHGCGEMPLPATVAAVANAIADAIGKRVYTLPITPEKILAALDPGTAGEVRAVEGKQSPA